MTTKIDQIITNINGDAYKKFVSDRKRIVSEEDLRIMFSSLINQILDKNNIRINQERHEYTVFKGRIDSLYGEVVIEYKAPNLLNEDNNSYRNSGAIEQIKTHILGLEGGNKLQATRYLGVIFDGYKIIFVRRRNKIWDIEAPTIINIGSFTLFLKRLLSLAISGKALIIDNLIRDFGTESEEIRNGISKFYYHLTNSKKPKTQLLYDQWQTYFRQVCGYEFETKKREIKELIKLYGIPDDEASLPKIIFSIHTLYSLFIKLLAAETLTYFRHREGSYISNINTSRSNQLKLDIQSLERGQLFQYEGISNFLEGDFFSWYLDNWNNDISTVVAGLIRKFKEYDFSSLNLEPKEAKDLIKGIYHYLLPKKIRHSLGEYYTPDWLAEHLLESLNINYSEDFKVLDPTCGSGTFITLLIEKIKEQEKSKGSNKNDIFSRIIKSVVGIDLNPLAVIASKTNFLISISDLLDYVKGSFEIPIYLSDSMLVTLEFHEQGKEYLSIPTKVGRFDLPANIIKKGYFANILELLVESVDVEDDPKNIKDKIIKSGYKFNEHEIETIKQLYNRILELEKQNLNGIWLKIIKNFFTPAFLEKFDYIVGNPPWLNWQTLPEQYRDSIKKYWTEYKIFLHKGLAARLGSAHDDLSVLLTYVVMDNFLKSDGKLGFVLPQNLLQASGGGEGFRRFMIKDTTPVAVLKVDDFIKVNPFSDMGASNKPAILIINKGKRTNYPVQYFKWMKNNSGRIPSDIRLSVAKQLLNSKSFYAEPIGDSKLNSPWIIAENRTVLRQLKNLVGKSQYRARKGIDTSLNGLYWGRIEPSRIQGILNFTNEPFLSRKDVKKYTVPIENKILYPILRGSDIDKWSINPEYFCLIPYHNDGSYIGVDELKQNYPHTYKFFYRTDEQIAKSLQKRAIYQKHLININAPIYSLYDIGSYTFSPYKVVWKALASGMIAAVISHFKQDNDINNLIIPDHNVLMVPLEDKHEAFYLCGMMNSKIVNKFVTAYISWFYSSHILDHLKIPNFDTSNKLHIEVSKLSEEAHNCKNLDDIKKIELKIDELCLEILNNK